MMATNFMIYGLGMLGFWICGFAFMFGGFGIAPSINCQPTLGRGRCCLTTGARSTIRDIFGLIGLKGFFLATGVFDTAIFTLFLFEMVFMDTTATIPTGAMAERWNFKHFIFYGFWVGMFPYAIYGNWVWGGGWLAQLGQNFGLGHGAVDFAGFGVVHMCGGVIALAGMAIGPRLGNSARTASRGHARPRPSDGHARHLYPRLRLVRLQPRFHPFGHGHRIAIIAVNTMLAGAAATDWHGLTMYILTEKFDPSMMCNGLLAGLVAITAPCAFVISSARCSSASSPASSWRSRFSSWNACSRWTTRWARSPCMAPAAAGVCSASASSPTAPTAKAGAACTSSSRTGSGPSSTTTAAKATFQEYRTMTGTDPKTGGWTDVGVSAHLRQLLRTAPAGDGAQFMAQFVDVCALFIFVFIFAFLWFKLSNLIVPLRSKKEDEIAGLDLPEMGAMAYPDYQLTDATSPSVH